MSTTTTKVTEFAANRASVSATIAALVEQDVASVLAGREAKHGDQILRLTQEINILDAAIASLSS